MKVFSIWDSAGKGVVWVGVSLFLNLTWEVAQLPLYVIPTAQTKTQIAYAVAHCTMGDAVIAAISFAVAALLLHDAGWPIAKPWRGGIVVVSIGTAYTAFSEWRNVYLAGNWGYTDYMPLVFGIGL